MNKLCANDLIYFINAYFLMATHQIERKKNFGHTCAHLITMEFVRTNQNTFVSVTLFLSAAQKSQAKCQLMKGSYQT